MADEKETKQEETKPGAFDTSEAVNVTTTLEEATEAGYLGASFDDSDLTVAGVTSETSSPEAEPDKPAEPEPAESPKPAEPERKPRRGE